MNPSIQPQSLGRTPMAGLSSGFTEPPWGVLREDDRFDDGVEPGDARTDRDDVSSDSDSTGAGVDDDLPSESDLASMTLEALDDQIGTLAGHLNAANYRLLRLIAELDRREPWKDLGYLSCAHYLNWRCGIALGAAREKVRAARALRGLPLIGGEFRRGRLSYSKVRALTRAATPANERELLQVALRGTATHVERVVRHLQQAQAAADPQLLLESRMCRSFWDDDGMLVVHARLTPEAGALFRKALDHAIDDVGTADSVGAEDHRAALRADALARVCEGFIEHEGGTGHAADRFLVHLDVPAGTLVAQESDTLAPDALAVLEHDGPPLSMQTLHRLCCDASIVVHAGTNPGDAPRRTRTISAGLRRSLQRRDGGCRFPGCTNTQFVDAHHIVHWARGGETTPDNLVLLCRRHHTLLHEHGYRIEVDRTAATEGVHFRFFEPDNGMEIDATGDKRSRGNVGSLMKGTADDGVSITPETAMGDRDGTAPNYDLITSRLMRGSKGVPAP